MIYFPDGTPPEWIFDSHVASPAERRSSSWDGVVKLLSPLGRAYQLLGPASLDE